MKLKLKLILFFLFGLLSSYSKSKVNIPVKKALVTGITGQDGSYLAELLLKKGYEVHGLKRRSSVSNTYNIDHIINNHKYSNSLICHYGDLTDFSGILRLIKSIQPDEIYNLAAQSHVQVSFDIPAYTSQATAVGALNILEAIRSLGLEKKVKFYQASSSEMFGKVVEIPQTEETSFYPRSPYGVSKLFAHWITKNYRESYGIFACSGILFNHESPRRGETFVTRKITLAVAKIKKGLQSVLRLGNLNAKRDWGYAKDYVKAMWLMLQQEKPDDYVIATGETHSIREFVELAFKKIDIEIVWKGLGLKEKGYDKKTGKILVEVDSKYFRPAEVDLLLGNPIKAKSNLGWSPKSSFSNLVSLMVKQDIKKV